MIFVGWFMIEVIPYSKLIGFDLHDLRCGLPMPFVATMDTKKVLYWPQL